MNVLNPDSLSQLRALEEPGQTGLLAEIVDTFRASSDCDIARLRQALEIGDHEIVLNAAHRIRGAAAALGADQLRDLAQALELRGREHFLTGAKELLAELENAHQQALAALAKEVGA